MAEGHRLVSEGWTLFKHTCEEVVGATKGVMTPTPSPSPVKTEPMEEEGEVKQLADLGVSGFIEMPIMIKLGPHEYTY